MAVVWVKPSTFMPPVNYSRETLPLCFPKLLSALFSFIPMSNCLSSGFSKANYHLIATIFTLFLLLPSGLVRGDLSPSDRGMRVLRVTNGLGNLERTVFLPEASYQSAAAQEESEDDGYILVSHSSSNKIKEAEVVKKKTVRRRRRRKKPTIMNNGTSLVNGTNFKDPKFLSLFTIVRFGNDGCGEGGICYHEFECRDLGGTVQGPCAKGFGVCCALEVNCGETTRKPQSLFVGGGALGACTLTVEKIPGTKQIRLDFYSLELDQPVDGNCLNERLLITGQNLNSIVPVICGSNSGQHIHLDVDEATGPLMVSVISPMKRDFRMKVTQLADGDSLLAPKNCLQYFTENSGVVQSFNYHDPPAESTYLNNMNYAICIKKNSGMCTVEYSATDSMREAELIFDIKNVDLAGDSTVPEGEAGAEVFNCPEDFLAIASVRLCGQKFNDATVEADFTKSAPVTDRSAGPFIMNFMSSPNNVGRGFKLQYQQQPC